MSCLPSFICVLQWQYWGWTFFCFTMVSMFASLENMLWKYTRFDALGRSALAGYLTNPRDIREYQAIQPYIIITHYLSYFIGAYVAFQLVRCVWRWVAHRHPGSSMVVSVNGFFNRVPSMDTISARARGMVWHQAAP